MAPYNRARRRPASASVLVFSTLPAAPTCRSFAPAAARRPATRSSGRA